MRTIHETIDEVARWNEHATALVQAEDGREYTYGELRDRSNAFANGLRDRGISSGDRVLFLTNLTIDYTVAWLGTIKAGALPTALHTRESADTILQMVDRVGGHAVVFDDAYREIADRIRGRLGDDALYVANDDPVPSFATGYGTVVADASTGRPETAQTPDDDAFINFSSGTTGVPKPIPHTHADAIETAHQAFLMFDVERTDVSMNVFSPSFIVSVFATVPYLVAGGTVVNLGAWDAGRVLDAIETHGVTSMVATPTQYRAVVHRADPGEYDLDTLTKLGYAGEPINADLYRTLRATMCEDLFTFYGGTEPMFGTVLYPSDLTEERLRSIGRPGPNIRIRVVEPGERDPTREVETGEIGELALRGPAVAEGVWDGEDESSYVDGWWFSGDLGRVSGDGYLYLEGRTDRMIISGGINVYPERVEAAIEDHPDVTACAVVDVPDEEWGRALRAHVVGEGLSAADLDDWCTENERLSDYQRPRSYEFVDDLPKTSSGKIDYEAIEPGE